MKKTIGGLFTDSQSAGEAIAELKEQGFTDEISFIAKDEAGEVTSDTVKESVAEGAGIGAATGGALGALIGVIAGTASVLIPGVGTFLVAGPLALIWGVTGGAIGALSGGVLGALIDAGIPEDKAEIYEERIMAGEVFVTVEAEESRLDDALEIMEDHGVYEVATIEEK